MRRSLYLNCPLFLTFNRTGNHEDYAGDIGPFQLAIALTALSMVVIFFWRENYGHKGNTSLRKCLACENVKLVFTSFTPIFLCPPTSSLYCHM